jgi:hypothetical protein
VPEIAGDPFLTPTDWVIFGGIAGWLIFIALLIVWSLMRKPPDPHVHRLRLGVFVERDREEPRDGADEDTKEWPAPPHT